MTDGSTSSTISDSQISEIIVSIEASEWTNLQWRHFVVSPHRRCLREIHWVLDAYGTAPAAVWAWCPKPPGVQTMTATAQHAPPSYTWPQDQVGSDRPPGLTVDNLGWLVSCTQAQWLAWTHQSTQSETASWPSEGHLHQHTCSKWHLHAETKQRNQFKFHVITSEIFPLEALTFSENQ